MIEDDLRLYPAFRKAILRDIPHGWLCILLDLGRALQLHDSSSHTVTIVFEAWVENHRLMVCARTNTAVPHLVNGVAWLVEQAECTSRWTCSECGARLGAKLRRIGKTDRRMILCAGCNGNAC